MLRLTALAIVLATPAAADVVKVSECAYNHGDDMARIVTCELTNAGDEAVSRVGYGFRISDPDRNIPWAKREWEKPEGPSLLRRGIPGGLEPGETIRKAFLTTDLSQRADIDAVTPEIRIHDVYNADGELITAPR